MAAVLTPVVNAQQFQTPTLPGPPATAVSLDLQARIQHAEALKAQMLRAQQEQGAPSEFAIKAYEAQQNYQAQRAFDEYMAYQKKQKQLEQRQQFEQKQPGQFSNNQVPVNPATTNAMTRTAPAPAPTGFQELLNRFPIPVKQASGYPVAARQIPSQIPSQPSTFVPPVHIAPMVTPKGINFGGEPKVQSTTSNQPQSSELKPVAYLRPAPEQGRATPQPLYAHQTSQATDRPRRQLATTQQIDSPQYSDPRPTVARQATTLNLPQPQTAYRQREYILQENGHVGLQDRISNLLSRPRYRDTNSGQPQLAQKPAQSVSRPQGRKPPTAQASQSIQNRTRPTQSGTGPHRPRFAGRADSKPAHRQSVAPVNRMPQFVQTQPARIPTTAVQHGQPASGLYAYEMRKPMERVNQNQRAVQQVMMVEPAQDPFNDQSVEVPPSNIRLQAPQDFYPSIPPDRQAFAVPLVDENTPTRQISVLSNRSQDEGTVQNNQFGQQPVNNNASQQQEPIGIQSAEDQKKVDEELNRRFQELEGKQGDETSRVDDMVKQLEQELEKGRMEQKDSVIGDGLENNFGQTLDNESQTVKSNLKTCDEFRNQLLKGSIRDISLDMSPLASRNRSQSAAISRSWTDRAGNVVATGTMVDLRRGYVIIDGTDGRQKISYAKLSDADWAAISEYWRIPELCSVGNQGDASRSWVPQTFTWKASALCHKPLFFENVQLERYGHTHGPIAQPIRSVAHFFVSFVTVPYQSGIHPATECQYALGFYRPGDCAPWLKDPIPFSLNGAARQAIITTGVAVIP